MARLSNSSILMNFNCLSHNSQHVEFCVKSVATSDGASIIFWGEEVVRCIFREGKILCSQGPPGRWAFGKNIFEVQSVAPKGLQQHQTLTFVSFTCLSCMVHWPISSERLWLGWFHIWHNYKLNEQHRLYKFT